jgi:hypothetical protein
MRIIARFTKDGCGYDPETGIKLPRGTNVMYHPVFWDIDKKEAEKIAEEHGAKLVICE